MQKKDNFLFVFLFVILIVPSVYSFDFSWEDKYGSTPSYQFGTYTDQFVFKNRAFNFNLSNIYEDMVCVEYNDFINEGGTRFDFEPNKCFYINGLSSAKKTGCANYMTDNYGAPTGGYTSSAYSSGGKMDFPMDTSVALDVDTIFKSFVCEPSKVNVSEYDTQSDYFIVGEKRRFDCGGSRSLDFDLEYYNERYDNSVGWWVLNSDGVCIDMVSDKNGYYYSVAPLSLSSGDVRCDELEDDKEITTYSTTITAQHTTNDHPCTIDEDVDVGDCSDIDEDECETRECNADNKCGYCTIDTFSINSGVDNDTDNNNILAVNGDWKGVPQYTLVNTDGDKPDCIKYSASGHSTFYIGDSTVGGNCATADDSPVSTPITFTSAIVSTENWIATAYYESCSLGKTYSYSINWWTVLASYFIDYDGEGQERQLRQDTDNVNITIRAPTRTLSQYECSVKCEFGAEYKETYVGSYPGGDFDYMCHLDTWAYFGACGIGEEITTKYKIYVDADVTYENSSIYSNTYYSSFGEGQAGSLPKMNRGLTINPTYDAGCYYNSACGVFDTNDTTIVGSYYNNPQTIRYTDLFHTVRIRYIDLDHNYVINTSTKYYTSVNTGFGSGFNWAYNYTFPMLITGDYAGRIEVCYDFSRYEGYFYCDYKNYVIQILPNTLTASIVVKKAGVIVDNASKYDTLEFCMDKSYVGANNTNVKAKIDYNGDGVVDYDGVYGTCLSHTFNISESAYEYTAQGFLYSNERTSSIINIDYKINGVCGDGYGDWDEFGFDNPNATSGWSEVCWGTCTDNYKTGNEISIDYGGRCGKCGNFSFKDEDLDYLLLFDSNYIMSYPFNESSCLEFKAVTGTMQFIIILYFFGILIIGGLIFIFAIMLIIFATTGRFLFFDKKNENKDKKETFK